MDPVTIKPRKWIPFAIRYLLSNPTVAVFTAILFILEELPTGK
jgi:hypothetical protein